MMMINLNLIDSNPYRDFELDPINPESVEAMAKSINELGFWGGLAVRKVDDRYQLAFGHHRLVALRAEGWTKADINVVKYDDAQMVKAMTTENMTQRGVEGGAVLDSVAAVIRVLGYALLTMDDAKVLNNYSGLFSKQSALPKARSNFAAGKGIGRDLICAYDNTLPERAVQNALATLRESNYMFALLTLVKEKIEAEAVEAQAAADATKTEAARKKAQDKADKLAAEAEAADAAAEQTKQEEHFDKAVSRIFNRDAHTKTFRELVTSANGKRFIPLNGQTVLADAILSDAEEEEANVTSAYIKKKVQAQLSGAMAMHKSLKKKHEQESANAAAEAAWKAFRGQLKKMVKSLTELETAMNAGGNPQLSDAQLDAVMDGEFQIIVDLVDTVIGDRLYNIKGVVSVQ